MSGCHWPCAPQRSVIAWPGYDTDEARVQSLKSGESYVEDVPSGELKQALERRAVPAVGGCECLRWVRRGRGRDADPAP